VEEEVPARGRLEQKPLQADSIELLSRPIAGLGTAKRANQPRVSMESNGCFGAQESVRRARGVPVSVGQSERGTRGEPHRPHTPLLRIRRERGP
jgi:hypothetical protein